MARYHVCMVLVGKLPVPATLGGAVEALAQHLLEQNERDPQIEFTVLTVDEPGQALAAGFRHAQRLCGSSPIRSGIRSGGGAHAGAELHRRAEGAALPFISGWRRLPG